MTKPEFAAVTAYLSAAVSKPMPVEQITIYYDLLADLPADAVMLAAKQALLKSAYPTIPPVGVLRELATAALAPEQLAAYEAWDMVIQAIRRHGLDGERRALESLPPAVARAASAIGWRSICDSNPADAGTIRAQFRQAYETVAGREQRERLLPAPLKDALTQLVGQNWTPLRIAEDTPPTEEAV